jgi:hypothetical protein
MTLEAGVLIFICSVAGLSILILLYFFVAKADDSPSDFHQNLAIGIFSVVVTAIVVLLGLTTFVKGGDAVAGKLGVITFNLAGPPAVWTTVFLITTKAFGSKSTMVKDNNNIQVFNIPLEHHYRMLGFDYYRNWKANLNEFGSLIEKEKSEFHFIEDLLPKVFYHGPHDLLKPQNVTNTTLFVFSKKNAVKFQRIKGVVKAEGDKRSRVYLPQTSSTPDGKLSSMYFVRSGNSIRETARNTHGEWKAVPLKDIDIMLLAVYENDDLENGDYVYIDVSKYIDLERNDAANVEIAIVSDKRIKEFNVWEVSASLTSTERPVPLMFRNLPNQPGRRKAADVEKNIEQIAEMFEGWDTVMDQALSSGQFGPIDKVSKAEAQDFLLKVKSVLCDNVSDINTTAFQHLFRRPPAEDCVVCKLEKQRNVILTTFAWG